MYYRIHVKRRGEKKSETYEYKARTLNDALLNFCKDCIEEDDTGIFFELNEADVNHFMTDRNLRRKFHMVHSTYGDYGIILEDLDIIDSRNPYLCKMRAKRELLGLNIEQAVALTGSGSYKAKEAGSRQMTLDEYASIMCAYGAYEMDDC